MTLSGFGVITGQRSAADPGNAGQFVVRPIGAKPPKPDNGQAGAGSRAPPAQAGAGRGAAAPKPLRKAPERAMKKKLEG